MALFDGATGDTVMTALERIESSKAEAQKTARDAFYASFGFFALSVPFPFFLNSLAQDYLVSAVTAGLTKQPDQAANLRLIGYVLTGSTVASIAASATLFTFMAINLASYIAAANRPAG